MAEITIFSILVIALTIDAVFGDPKWLYRIIPHPTVLLGWLVSGLDNLLNSEGLGDASRRFLGIVAVAILLGVAGAVGWGLLDFFKTLPYGWVWQTLAISTLIAQRSLYQHVAAVSLALKTKPIDAARQAVAQIVGRKTQELDEAGVSRAAIESLAENYSDGVVAPVFWTILFGLPGLLVYKALNTADSMIGYRNDKYLSFGWAAAKLDDAANYLPARLSGLIFCLGALILGGNSHKESWRIIRRDALKQLSPNAGYPEAAMAGALNVRLTGPRAYAGETVEGEWIGDGKEDANAEDIDRALVLYLNGCLLLSALVIMCAVISK